MQKRLVGTTIIYKLDTFFKIGVINGYVSPQEFRGKHYNGFIRICWNGCQTYDSFTVVSEDFAPHISKPEIRFVLGNGEFYFVAILFENYF